VEQNNSSDEKSILAIAFIILGFSERIVSSMSIGMNMVAKIGILPETSKYSSEKFLQMERAAL